MNHPLRFICNLFGCQIPKKKKNTQNLCRWNVNVYFGRCHISADLQSKSNALIFGQIRRLFIRKCLYERARCQSNNNK